MQNAVSLSLKNTPNLTINPLKWKHDIPAANVLDSLVG